MPFKDPEKRRAYHKLYMRKRRAGAAGADRTAVKPDVEAGAGRPLVKPTDGEGRPLAGQIDLTKPYTIESRFPHRAWLVQGGNWYDPETGRFVKRAP